MSTIVDTLMKAMVIAPLVVLLSGVSLVGMEKAIKGVAAVATGR